MGKVRTKIIETAIEPEKLEKIEKLEEAVEEKPAEAKPVTEKKTKKVGNTDKSLELIYLAVRLTYC